MFVCYQNDIPSYVVDTLDAVDAIPLVTFTKIEEVEFAEMFNGIIYTSEEELFKIKTKTVEETRASLYAAKVDPITAHINRLRDEEVTTPELETEIASLIEERKQIVAQIKEENPYPVSKEAGLLDKDEEFVEETEEKGTIL